MEESRHNRTMSETKAFPVDRSPFTIRHLVVIFTLVIGTSMNANHASAVLDHDPVEFVDVQETPLNHFAVVERTGGISDIYVGGKNYIYHLNEDLSLHQTENTCSPQCDGNDNKILVVAPSPVNRLITCGSYDGKCDVRKLSNISEAFQSNSPVTNTETPAVGVFDSDSHNFFVGVSPQFDPETSINYVSKWSVDPTDSSDQLQFLVQTNQPSSDASILNVEVKFRSGFVQSGFTYFVTNQQQLEYDGGDNFIPPADLPYVSKLNRVCQTSSDFDTFTDVPIECSAGDGTSYNLIQAIDVSLPGRNLAEALGTDGSALLYAVFAASWRGYNTDTPTANSALCIYKMIGVEDKFLETIQNCLNQGSAYGSKLLNSRCLNLQSSLEATRLQCSTDNYQYASAPIDEPLQATAVLQMEGTLATSIETAIEENETIAFIGSSAGQLLKVHIGSATQARLYEEVSIDNTQVQQDTYFDQENDQLYLLTQQKLVRLSVANCSRYTTCDECIGQDGEQDGNPYCGWCTLEDRCTRYRDCSRMDEPMFGWLPYSAERCINLTGICMAFNVPASTPSQQISTSQFPASYSSTPSPGDIPVIPCIPAGQYGLNSEAKAGFAILSLLLATSLAANVCLVILLRRKGSKLKQTATETNDDIQSRSEVNTDDGADDIQLYEMIAPGTSTDSTYTEIQHDFKGDGPVSISAANVSFLTRLGPIGSGEFGDVWKGELNSPQGRTAIAIQQIRGNKQESSTISSAVQTLSSLTGHHNVVACIGYCPEQQSILYEFVSEQSLLTHLQTNGAHGQSTYGNIKGSKSRLDETSLLKFACQVANGMDFLSSRKITHGSLCAHNILMTEKNECKISDYGLVSMATGQKPKPTRWSSPETMMNGACSVESDVWSFGIVLWEIVTLGAKPYPGMNFTAVKQVVTYGYKMPRPRHCGQPLYDIMSECWENAPTKRTTFNQTLRNLEQMLEQAQDYISMDELDAELYQEYEDTV